MPDEVLTFGEGLELDRAAYELRRGGLRLKLERIPMETLLLLVERRGQLVTRDDIVGRIWGKDVFLDTDTSINSAIRKIRQVLKDDPENPAYIQTVTGKGYRFIATVVDDDPPNAAPVVTQPAALLPSGGGVPAGVPRLEDTTPFEPRRPGISWKWIVSVAALVVIAAAGAYLLHARRPALLTEKDTVVLADFTNTTGDPVFDETLRQGLAVQLEQSPFLNLVSDERIRQVLQLMEQPSDARLTPQIARQVCERTSSAAVLEGSIAALGSQYVLGLRATNCRNGDILADEQVQAARKEDVLHALGETASKLRSRLGESLTTVEKYNTPLEEVTTPSLEALKAFSLGRKKLHEGENTAALPFLNQAVTLDPNFAAAYSAMAFVYSDHLEPERSAENARKAYELRDKVSERERLGIEAAYYIYGTGELDKAVSVQDILQQIYPRAFGPYGTQGASYRRLGETEKALADDQEAMRLAPDAPNVYYFLGLDYMGLNRLDEADAVYKEAERLKLPGPGRIRSRYLLAFLKGDTAEMEQLAAAAMGKPGSEDPMLASEADTEAWYGRLKNARELTRRAMASADERDARENAAGYQAAQALVEAETGYRDQARTGANLAIKLAPNRDVQKVAAVALARAGDWAAAEKLAAALDKAYPLDTLVQRYWLPVIRAAIALQRNDPNQAVQLLETARSTELANPSLLPVYLRGEAYLKLHDGSRAAAEFQKFIDHRGLVRNSPWGALARLELARAYSMQGDTAKARAEYQEFLTFWKDADPELAPLKQAKAEYAALH